VELSGRIVIGLRPDTLMPVVSQPIPPNNGSWRRYNSLLGAEPNGINNYGIDEPDVAPGPLHLNGNPRNGLLYFNTALFSENALGTPGTASRRFFSGPGMANFDMAILKNLRPSNFRCERAGSGARAIFRARGAAADGSSSTFVAAG
jgi:hypothetical protein